MPTTTARASTNLKSASPLLCRCCAAACLSRRLLSAALRSTCDAQALNGCMACVCFLVLVQRRHATDRAWPNPISSARPSQPLKVRRPPPPPLLRQAHSPRQPAPVAAAGGRTTPQALPAAANDVAAVATPVRPSCSSCPSPATRCSARPGGAGPSQSQKTPLTRGNALPTILVGGPQGPAKVQGASGLGARLARRRVIDGSRAVGGRAGLESGRVDPANQGAHGR
jgi:hypothetical protein